MCHASEVVVRNVCPNYQITEVRDQCKQIPLCHVTNSYSLGARFNPFPIPFSLYQYILWCISSGKLVLFRSRNVFLRVTDVRKYCYYSSVVWTCVVIMAVMAICAHFLLDTGTNPNRKSRMQFSSSIIVDDVEQETIGMFTY